MKSKRSKLIALILLTVLASLTGCAHQSLTAPCPDFGSGCTKVPINSWNTNY